MSIFFLWAESNRWGMSPFGPHTTRITLSGQRENYAGVGVSLERGAAGEARVDVMPPFELVAFAELPAEQDDTAIAE